MQCVFISSVQTKLTMTYVVAHTQNGSTELWNFCCLKTIFAAVEFLLLVEHIFESQILGMNKIRNFVEHIA